MISDPLLLSTDVIVDLMKLFLRHRKPPDADEALPEWVRLEKAYVDHLEWRFSYPRQVFGQQILTTWLLTILVIGLVVSGLIFAFLQLSYALSLGDLSSLESDLKIETAGNLSCPGSAGIGQLPILLSDYRQS